MIDAEPAEGEVEHAASATTRQARTQDLDGTLQCDHRVEAASSTCSSAEPARGLLRSCAPEHRAPNAKTRLGCRPAELTAEGQNPSPTITPSPVPQQARRSHLGKACTERLDHLSAPKACTARTLVRSVQVRTGRVTIAGRSRIPLGLPSRRALPRAAPRRGRLRGSRPRSWHVARSLGGVRRR